MITVFIPCRAGSERVPEKNTRSFAGLDGGLLKIKLDQILRIKLVDKIILSTNDTKVIEIAQNISDRVVIDVRSEELSLSSTSTDDLIKYIPSIITEGHVLWTHTTSPFLTHDVYSEAIKIYLENLEIGIHDSLMTVNRLQTFLWDQQGSFNYDRNIEKWPRTQTLKKLYEVNSGIFINSIDNYIKYEDRIGSNPYLMNVKGFSSFDIDWPEDFELAEMIYRKINNI
jgi:CMP-N-acetylneuraminic acid synthetase